MRRFLFDIHYPTFGGPHNQAVQLADPLRQGGWETVVLLPEEEGNALGRFLAAGIPVVQAPLRRVRASADPRLHARFLLGLAPEIARIRRLIREQEIDVVMIAGLYTVQTAVAARLEGVPIVWQVLDTLSPPAARRLLMQVVTRFADVVMTTGMTVAREHPGAVELGNRLVPYFPPVRIDRFRPDPARREAARRELGVPDDAPLIGSVGNLNRTKGHLSMLRAAKLVREQLPEAYLRILAAFTPTHAAYGEAVQAEGRELGLFHEDRLRIVDPGNRVAELLPAFDVFLSTAIPLSEGVPTTILEAMSCGIPVVATDVGGVAEIVEDGVTGFLVPSLDTDAIVAATVRLLQAPALRAEMAANARRIAVERYDSKNCVEEHLRAFDLATSHASARRK